MAVFVLIIVASVITGFDSSISPAQGVEAPEGAAGATAGSQQLTILRMTAIC